MIDQLQDGINESVEPDLMNKASEDNLPVHYSSHHGVIRQDNVKNNV